MKFLDHRTKVPREYNGNLTKQDLDNLLQDIFTGRQKTSYVLPTTTVTEVRLVNALLAIEGLPPLPIEITAANEEKI